VFTHTAGGDIPAAFKTLQCRHKMGRWNYQEMADSHTKQAELFFA